MQLSRVALWLQRLLEAGLSLTGSLFPFLSSSAPGSALEPYSPCNKNCECQTDSFTPVCGTDGITYLSGCFAGCKSTVWRFLGAMGQGTRATTAAHTRRSGAGVDSHPRSILCGPALLQRKDPPSAGWDGGALQAFWLNEIGSQNASVSN